MGLELVKEKTSGDLLNALQNVLKDYLSQKPSRSLNGLSKRCTVSEPTLRRILKGQIKTLPTSTTILDILTTLTGEKNTALISKSFPGPISDYLETTFPQGESGGTEYDADLNDELKDPVKYLIYKLASNSSGVSEKKISELFGRNGLKHTESLVQKNYLYVTKGIVFSKVKNFTINQENFVNNFKLIADFIKTQKPLTKTNLQAVLANYSESVSAEAYKEIVSHHKKHLEKIRNIMSDEKSKGSIPLFFLLATDTLDTKSAHELVSELPSKDESSH